MTSNQIHVNGLRFWAHHGCMEEEAIIGQEYRVDVTLWVNLAPSAATDVAMSSPLTFSGASSGCTSRSGVWFVSSVIVDQPSTTGGSSSKACTAALSFSASPVRSSMMLSLPTAW